MKIHTIKISNLLSFPYKADLKKDTGITFPVGASEAHTHILIGPNGSGKSNFLSIVNYMFRVGMIDRYALNEQYLTAEDAANYDKTIIQTPHPLISLKPHIITPEKPSAIVLDLYLSQLDRENIAFIIQHAAQINEMLGTYSRIPVRFDPTIALEEVMNRDTLHVRCDINTRTGSISTICLDEDPLGQQLFSYLKYFEAIQHLITVFNMFVAKTPEEKVHHLNNTFAIIGGYRRLSHLDSHYDLHFRHGSDVLQTIAADEDFFSQANMPIGFEMLKKKLAQAYHGLCPAGDKPCSQVLAMNAEYIAINELLQEYTGFLLRVHREEHDATRYTFFLEDEEGHRYEFDDLSSGDKAIIFLITTMYGFDLQNGLVVIDEPELHLHPQLQKRLLSLLQKVSNGLLLQCIIATHSSILINENNIQYVYRFFYTNSRTHVIAPLHSYHEGEANLVQILRFTNTAKIFFVNKIIMVEGEIDELFFGYYLTYLAESSPERGKKITNFEIININGKGSFKRRKKFLDKFGLQSYFIGDWDNIQETGVKVDMSKYRKYVEKIPKTQRYPTLIQMIQEHHPEKWQEIISFIDELYVEGIFLLKQGDVETYMGLEEKGVEETIEFYHHEFARWIKDPAFAAKRKEMEDIIEHIFA